MADKYRLQADTFDGPADDGYMIVPSDVTVFSQPTRALYVGETGNVCVTMSGSNTTLTFVGVQAGTTMPIRVSRVFANTTANSLVGLF